MITVNLNDLSCINKDKHLLFNTKTITASEVKVMTNANENMLYQLDSKTSNDATSFFKS